MVPEAESRVRPPDTVSISPEAVIPTRIASSVAPAKVGLSVVPTAWPIAMVGAEPSPVPEPDEKETPVPAVMLET